MMFGSFAFVPTLIKSHCPIVKVTDEEVNALTVEHCIVVVAEPLPIDMCAVPVSVSQ